MTKPHSQPSVLHLADFGSPYPGNFISSISGLSAQLSASGYRLVLVLNQNAKDRAWLASLAAVDHVTPYFIDNKSSLLTKTQEISRIAAKENSVLIHTHFTGFDMAAWMARVLGRSKFALVWHVHSAFPTRSTLRRRIKDFIKFKIAGRSVLSLHVSESTLELETRRGLMVKNAAVVPNAVDVRRFEPVRKAVSLPDASAGKPSAFLMFGWEPHTKGVDVALKAFERLFKERQDFQLLLVGEERLQAFVEDYFRGSLPLWLCLLRPAADVTTLYLRAQFFLSASRYEGSSYSVAEALACGMPVISSDIPGIQWAKKAPVIEFFTSEQSGSLEVLAGKLLDHDYLDYGNRSHANSVFIEENYSMEAWAEAVFRIYRKLLHP